MLPSVLSKRTAQREFCRTALATPDDAPFRRGCDAS
jgi:hypothetical protein